MTRDVWQEFPGLLRKATTDLGPETVQVRREAITALAQDPVTQDLVLAAYGRPTPSLTEQIENHLQAADPSYVRGDSGKLLSVVSAVAVLQTLNSSAPGALRAALLVESAHFLGFEPEAPQLLEDAGRVVDEHARAARDRAGIPPATPRFQSGSEPTAVEIATKINAMLKRYDDAINIVSSRQTKMDEEINALWWARSTRNLRSGKRWVDLTQVERAVNAALDLSDILSCWPASAGMKSLLRDVCLDLDGEARLIEVGESAAQTQLGEEESGVLLPISLAAYQSRQFPEDSATVASIMRKDGVDSTLTVAVANVPDQILREIQLRML